MSKLRILIITQGVSRIIKHLMCSEHAVVAILEAAPRSYKPRILHDYILSFLRAGLLIFKKEKITLKQLCREKKIPYRFMVSSDDIDLEDWIRRQAPDVIVVFSMSQLLKENIFNIPKYGAINLHPSYLPEYRGPNPDFWQYYDRELSPGVTVHYIDAGEDTGDIIFQERIEVPLGINSPQRLDRLIDQCGVRLLLKSLDSIQSGIVQRIKQPAESPTKRARNIKLSEHCTIIDWVSWDIERIWNILRGTELWLNAFEQPKGLYKGMRWSVEGFDKCDMSGYGAGRVYRQNRKLFFVACKEGKIYLSVKFNVKQHLINFLRKL